MKIPFSPPDITQAEIDEVIDTLKSGWITTGPKTKRFENELALFCNTNKFVCLSSATACMEMTLNLLGIGEGDEVITSAYTYSASASVIAHVGAKIMLVDTDENSFFISPEKIQNAITDKTKAIICVDIAGVPCDYNAIYEAVNSKASMFSPKNDIAQAIGRVALIADAAHSLGAEYLGKKTGTLTDFSCFSFHAVKNLTTGEGGGVTWNAIEKIDDERIYREFMLLSLHGQDRDALAKTKPGAWEYDIVAPYYKCNMTDIMAALGLAQLKRYPAMLANRQEIIYSYNRELKDSDVVYLEHYTDIYKSSGHLYLLRLNGKTIEERNAVIEKMAQVGVATNVHYKPLPLLSAYKSFDIKFFQNAYNMYLNEITLPLFSSMTLEQAKYVTDVLKGII